MYQSIFDRGRDNVFRWMRSLAESHSLHSIREGLLWSTPALLLSAALQICAGMGELTGVLSRETSDQMWEINRRFVELTPLLIASAIGYILSIHHRLPGLPVALLQQCRHLYGLV